MASGFLTGKYRSEADVGSAQRGAGVKKYLTPKGAAVLKALDEALKMNSDATADQLRLASEVSALQSLLQVAEQQARATEQLVRSECDESDSRFAVVAHCSSPHVPESDPKISNSRPRCYSAAR